MTWVAFDHLVGWFEAGGGDFANGVLFVKVSVGRNDWCVGGKWEVNTWVRDQVSLELIQINIQSSIESK